jgi:hypothetical protein
MGKVYVSPGLPYAHLKDQMLRIILRHPGITTGQLEEKVRADVLGEV